MSDGSAPFQTKNTLGLLTIDWNKQPHPDEIKTPEDIAAEEAAKAAIATRKAKKAAQAARSRSRSKSAESLVVKAAEPVERRKKKAEPVVVPVVDDEAVKEKARLVQEKKEQEEAAKRQLAQDEQEAKRKGEEEVRLRKIQEEEAARLAEEEQLAEYQREKEEEEEAEAAQLLAEEQVRAARIAAESVTEEVPPPPKRKMKRRISSFPSTPDNTGLVEAVKRYDNVVPFDWEKPEWTMDFGNLRHTTTQTNSYGWTKPDWTTKNGLRSATTRESFCESDTPEWARRSTLRPTALGEVAKHGANLERPIMRRSYSFSDRPSDAWSKPAWATRDFLKSTVAGTAVRYGIDLGHPISDLDIESVATTEKDSAFAESFSSLNASKTISWEKPEWTKNPGLKSTDTGTAARKGANLAFSMSDMKYVMDASERQAANDALLGSSMAKLNTSIAWEKPSWASNPMLKRTSKGQRMKENGTLAKPISSTKKGLE